MSNYTLIQAQIDNLNERVSDLERWQNTQKEQELHEELNTQEKIEKYQKAWDKYVEARREREERDKYQETSHESWNVFHRNYVNTPELFFQWLIGYLQNSNLTLENLNTIKTRALNLQKQLEK